MIGAGPFSLNYVVAATVIIAVILLVVSGLAYLAVCEIKQLLTILRKRVPTSAKLTLPPERK